MTQPNFVQDVYLVGKNSARGNVIVGGDSIVWKAKYGERTLSIPSSDVEGLKFMPIREGFELSVTMRGGALIRLQGFEEENLESLRAFASKTDGVNVDVATRSTRGWNWGDCLASDNSLKYVVEGDLAFEIPFADVAQTVRAGKRDVALELHQDDTTRPEEESLVDIRFYCPPNVAGPDDDRKESELAEEAVSEFYDMLSSKTKAIGPQDEAIASFSDVLFVVPRGRYELEMYSQFLRMHGKTFSYKILYKSINRVFMLKRPDQHIIFAVHLDPAIRQGNTLYPYLLMNIAEEDEIELRPNLDKEVIEKNYQGTLAEEMEGPLHDIIARVLFALTKKKIIAGGSFRSQDGHDAVQCSLKAHDGLLFPLSKSFFYIYKPTLYIRYDEIASVEFARVDTSSGGSSRTFDLLLNLRGGVHHVFAGLDRDEYEILLEFLRSKKLHIISPMSSKKSSRREHVSRSGRRIRTVVDEANAMEIQDIEEEDEEEDEDFRSEESSEVSDE